MTKEQVAHCELCGDVNDSSLIGEDCERCNEGFYEDFIKMPCDIGEACTEPDHVFNMHGAHYHLTLTEDMPEDA